MIGKVTSLVSKIQELQDHLRNRWLCTDCVVTIPVMYNPFNVLSYDRHDPNKIECNDDIESISQILNSCKVYDKMKFTKSIRVLVNKKAIAKKAYSRLFSTI